MLRQLFISALLVPVIPCACLAQTTTTPADAPPQSQATPATSTDSATKTPAPKKVWTNENLSESNGRVSVVGDTRNQKYTMTHTRPADPATVSQIREKLQKLLEQLDNVNQQLTSFKEFQEGEPITKGSDDAKKGYTRMPVNQQMTVLQDKKKKLQSQIDDLLDEARKKGIDSSQLR
jgi:hypothetical protein